MSELNNKMYFRNLPGTGGEYPAGKYALTILPWGDTIMRRIVGDTPKETIFHDCRLGNLEDFPEADAIIQAKLGQNIVNIWASGRVNALLRDTRAAVMNEELGKVICMVCQDRDVDAARMDDKANVEAYGLRVKNGKCYATPHTVNYDTADILCGRAYTEEGVSTNDELGFAQPVRIITKNQPWEDSFQDIIYLGEKPYAALAEHLTAKTVLGVT